MMKIITVVFITLAAISGIPRKTKMTVIKSGPSDLQVSPNHMKESKNYDPNLQNKYHLFTRDNPHLSEEIKMNDRQWLIASNFDFRRRTIVIIHGWQDNATAPLITVLVPAFLEAEDLNVIVVDWSAGSSSVEYPVAVLNTPVCGGAVAKLLRWLSKENAAEYSSTHMVGYNLGAHMAGIVGRKLSGKIAYITGLDPAFTGWMKNKLRFKSTDAEYTEIIHTSAGQLGYPNPLGHTDFYPNGGVEMPGCVTPGCDSYRSFHYFAESIKTGGFIGIRCKSVAAAMAGECFMNETLEMGGLAASHGETGIYFVRTNPYGPFSIQWNPEKEEAKLKNQEKTTTTTSTE